MNNVLVNATVKRREIVSRMTRTRFIKIEDALDDFGKLRFYVGEYVAGRGQTVYAHHFMDIDDARVVFSDIADGRPVQYQEYKGTGDVSRMLQIKSAQKPGAPHGERAAHLQVPEAYWFELVTRPGQRMKTGAVKPVGEPTAQVSIGLNRHTARALAHAVLAYVRVWEQSALRPETLVVSGE